MHSVQFHASARAELMEAQDWYEGELAGLGRRFLLAVDTTVQRVSENPQQFPVVHRKVRRALLKGFPYALMFVLGRDKSVFVLACFHASRDPKVWLDR
jgi:plasmid stabilization system protein ParE